MTAALGDPRAALDAAAASDLVQRKIAIDAMKKRVSGGVSEERKLREACEGFESIFLQKMWEQMRKNVQKEGYLHSKDEEAYQSMFDTELAKKMASAGGIGLADMLYEQLGQKLAAGGRSTSAGGAGKPLPIEPARPARAERKEETQEPAKETPPADLYSEIADQAAQAPQEDPAARVLREALEDLAASRDPADDPANATYPMFDLRTGAPMNPVAEKIKEEAAPEREIALTPMPERVSPPGRAKPSNALNGVSRAAQRMRRNTARAAEQQEAGAASAMETAPAVSRPKNPPVAGEVISSYGRQSDADGGGWNTGVTFAAAPGSPVTAPMGGVISFAGEKNGAGHVVVAHEDGLTSHYTNVTSSRTVGEEIFSGMEFAEVSGTPTEAAISDTGTALPPGRVHFEVRRGELAINPQGVMA